MSKPFTKPIAPTILFVIGFIGLAVAAYIVWSIASAPIEMPQIY